MGKCPRCQTTLRPIETKGLTLPTCAGCLGKACTLQALRQKADGRYGDAMLKAAAQAPVTLPCPGCGQKMCGVKVATRSKSWAMLDVCATCQLVWFDRGELEQLRPPTAQDLAKAREPKPHRPLWNEETAPRQCDVDLPSYSQWHTPYYCNEADAFECLVLDLFD